MNKAFKQLGIDTAYLLGSFPIALPAFVIAVTGFSAGVSTLVIWLGVPILALTLLALRGLAAAGRAPLATVTGQEVATPRYKRAPASASALRRLLTSVTDGQSWLNLLWAVVNFPIAVAGFVVALSWWAATLSALTYPLYGWIIRRAVGEGDGLEHATRWLGWGDSYLALSALTLIGGVIMALLLPLVLRGFALTQAGIGRGLLASSLPQAEVAENHDDLEQHLGTLDDELARVRERLSTAGKVH